MKIYKELQISVIRIYEQDVIRTSDEGTIKDNYGDWVDGLVGKK